MDKYIKKILQANIYDLAVETPLDFAPVMSARYGRQLFLKREDLQPVFSFKVRGAYNKLRQLSDSERAKGVIAASAGNHAQGVALAAARLGIKAVIVMGENTPAIKVNAVRALGAEVVLYGDSFDDAAARAQDLIDKHGYTFVHPFDDIDVIAGQGTIGVELMKQHDGVPEAIFVPVGGGGLISGIGTYVKFLRPEVRIIGVEAEGSASMWAAMSAGRRVTLKDEEFDQFADGTAVKQVGKTTFQLARKCVDEVIKVSVDEICASVKDFFEEKRVISEPAGALAIAGMKKYMEANPGQTDLIAVISGANMNFDRLRHISERTEIGERREILLGVTIPEKPGSFKRFCRLLGKRSVTEFNYRYSDAGEAHVLVGIQTQGSAEDRAAVTGQLGKHYEVTDLSDNELAILHVRHMVGGRSPGIRNEHLFRFEFPEKPGALMKFLDVLGDRYNISMFHYRNHGSAYGRVFVGIQVPAEKIRGFRQDLKSIGYRHWEESDNPAYSMFLGG